jgi:chemotaxis protein MotB
MIRSRWIVVGAVAAAALTLGGCKSVSRSDYDMALQEASDLRAQNDSLQQQLEDCEARYKTLAEQGGDAGMPDDGSGFEGEGVSVRRGAGGELIVTVAGDVLFDSGSATLKNNAKSTLDRIAGGLQSGYSSNLVRVEGYTDSDPIRKSNWKSNERLSAERAMAVEQYLVSKGIDNERIYSAAFGPSRPKGSKKDSRRVEIVILAAGA